MKKIILPLIVLIAIVIIIVYINKPVPLDDSAQNTIPIQIIETKIENSKSDFESLKEEALKGDSKAQNELGNMYANGSETTQSDEEALKLFEQSAKQGYSEAQYNLGTIYQNAIGVEQDFKKAIMYYKLAANQGHKEAKENLDVICQQDSSLCN